MLERNILDLVDIARNQMLIDAPSNSLIQMHGLDPRFPILVDAPLESPPAPVMLEQTGIIVSILVVAKKTIAAGQRPHGPADMVHRGKLAKTKQQQNRKELVVLAPSKLG